MHTDHIIGRRGTETLSESGPTSPGTVASHANVTLVARRPQLSRHRHPTGVSSSPRPTLKQLCHLSGRPQRLHLLTSPSTPAARASRWGQHLRNKRLALAALDGGRAERSRTKMDWKRWSQLTRGGEGLNVLRQYGKVHDETCGPRRSTTTVPIVSKRKMISARACKA